jgi:hypothetical protein
MSTEIGRKIRSDLADIFVEFETKIRIDFAAG